MEKGETHVPEMVTHKGFGLQKQRKLFRTVLGKKLGTAAYGMAQTFNHLVVSTSSVRLEWCVCLGWLFFLCFWLPTDSLSVPLKKRSSHDQKSSSTSCSTLLERSG